MSGIETVKGFVKRNGKAIGMVSALGVGAIAPAAGASTRTSQSASSQPEMSVQYELTTDANPALAKLQEEVGVAAVSSAVLAPFQVSINGKAYKVGVHVPEATSAREQIVVFTGNSKNAGTVLDDILKTTNFEGETSSITLYGLSKSKNGSHIMSGPSLSVVGQETSGTGLFQNIATERCQGLEITSSPVITSASVYHVAKEAICNSVGVAADSRELKMSYGGYEARLHGEDLNGQKVDGGMTVPFPIVSEQQYNDLLS